MLNLEDWAIITYYDLMILDLNFGTFDDMHVNDQECSEFV